jgi:hypothetical protein
MILGMSVPAFTGAWRSVYVATAAFAFYLNAFVGVVPILSIRRFHPMPVAA